MERRAYLAGLVTVGIAALAGCSSDDGESGGDGNGGGNETSGEGERGAGTNVESVDALSTEGEALETGQAPPDETGTPFEETNTVPEEDGLETGQAPNATDD